MPFPTYRIKVVGSASQTPLRHPPVVEVVEDPEKTKNFLAFIPHIVPCSR